MKKRSITLNRPLYVGTPVLGISKLILYNFHYKFIVNTYCYRVRLCMTDTGSFLYYIQTDDVYKDIEQNHALFDTSDYPPSHPSAKCYSLVTLNYVKKKVAKGGPRAAIANQLKHDLYKECVKSRTQTYTTSQSIRSNRHNIHTQLIVKQSLSLYDDKRYILDDGEQTLAYGHFRIRKSIITYAHSLS